MRSYARIENGSVREKITLADAVDIGERFHPSLLWIETTGLSPQPQEAWRYVGTAFTAPRPFPLTKLKDLKRVDFMTEGVARIAAQVPDWDSLEAIKTAAGLWPAISGGATPAMILAKDIYLYVRNAVPPKLAALTTQAALEAIDPTAADPFGDGTIWPA